MRNSIYVICLIVFVVFSLAPSVLAEEQSQYSKFLQGKATSMTVRTMGLFILASPHETENVRQQIKSYWWSSNPELAIEEAQRDLADAVFRQQFDTVISVVKEKGLAELSFAGYTALGTTKSVEIYFVGDSSTGPAAFRISITFRDDGPPLVHQVKVAKGFDDVRVFYREIRHVAGDNIATVAYDPERQKKVE